MSDARTCDFYDAEAAAYAASARVSPYLNDFIAELAPHAAVLDLGCGAGQDSAVLRDAGFAVTSMDASLALAAKLSACTTSMCACSTSGSSITSPRSAVCGQGDRCITRIQPPSP